MKHIFGLFLMVMPIVASDILIQQRTALYGGLAVAVGEGSESMNPGLNAGFESYAQIKKMYGIGGCLEYTWLSVDFPASAPKSVRASVHYWNVGVVQKLILEVNEIVNVFGEATPGFYLGLATYHSDSYKDSEWEPDFGLSFGTGVNIKYFIFKFNFKVAFTEQESTKWITLCIGYGG